MKDIYFTKTMIQNYNRVNVLPELIDGRYYSRVHLVYLYYINLLKSDFQLKDIKNILDSLNTDENMLDVHEKILNMKNIALEYRKNYIKNIENITQNEHEKTLLLMLETNSIKNELF